MKTANKAKMDGAGMRRIYFVGILILQLIAYPISIFNIGEYNDWVYYGIILSCFLTSVVFLKKEAQSYLQVGALYFTCIADYCLILGMASRETGVAFFFVAQLVYATRTLLLAQNKRERMANLSIRAALCVGLVVAVFLVFGEQTEALFVLSVLYYANLLVNIGFAFLHFKGNELFAIGLTLFALCDTVLGLHEIIELFSISHDGVFYKILHPPFALEASFYCPSQVLLSISAYKVHKNAK